MTPMSMMAPMSSMISPMSNMGGMPMGMPMMMPMPMGMMPMGAQGMGMGMPMMGGMPMGGGMGMPMGGMGMPMMMPMPMMTRCTLEMAKDGMICKMMPMDGAGMEMLSERCNAMSAMMAMGMPMMIVCGGMPMMMGMPAAK